MGVRKRKDGYYVVSYRDENGRGRTRSFGRGREAARKAKEFDLDVQLKKSRGEPLPVSRAEGMYLDELTQLWINEKKAQGRAVNWLRDWSLTFNRDILPRLCNRPTHLVTQADVMALALECWSHCAQSTRNRYIGYLKATMQYGVDHEHLQKNPLAKWKKGKEQRHESALTLADLRRLKAAATEHLAWALECAWHIPARPGRDLFSLTFARHVDFDRGGVHIYHGKVGKWAWIVCPEQFMRALHLRQHMHKSGHLIEYKGEQVLRLDKALGTAAARTKLPYPVRMYDVRHLWITTMLDQGVTVSAIAEAAGTSPEMIVKNYYEGHGAEKQRMAASLPRLDVERESGKIISISDKKAG